MLARNPFIDKMSFPSSSVEIIVDASFQSEMDSKAPNAPVCRPSPQELLALFADDEDISKYLEWLLTGPNAVQTFSVLPEVVFTTQLGEEKGKLLYNAAFPGQPHYSKIASLEEVMYSRATNLRNLLRKIEAEDWTGTLTNDAKIFEDQTEFKKAFNHVPKRPPKAPDREADMYHFAQTFFGRTVRPLGLEYITESHKKSHDELYPDGRVVKDEEKDITDHAQLVLRTILDVEIKKPWTTIAPEHRLGPQPWYYLPSSGTSGSTPTSGLKEVIKRAVDFVKKFPTAQPATDQSPIGQSTTYTAVISDLHKFVFFKMDREGQIYLTQPIEDLKTAMAMVWWICSESSKASGFRDSVANIYDRQIRNVCPSPSEFSCGPLESDSGVEWRLSSLRWIGGGNHGFVFSCRQSGTSTELNQLCLKVAPLSDSGASEQLEFEALHLGFLRRCGHVPKVISLGKIIIGPNHYRALLTDVVGVPLPKLSENELESILPNLWSEMLSSVQEIHSHRVIHGDIKPDHFVVNPFGLWVIDFGSAFTSSSISLREGKLYTSAMFNSTRVLTSNEWPDEEDDVQSTAYSYVALLSPGGVLPEGHQSNPNILLKSVKLQHRKFVQTALSDAKILKLPILEDDFDGTVVKKLRHQSDTSTPKPKRSISSNFCDV